MQSWQVRLLTNVLIRRKYGKLSVTTADRDRLVQDGGAVAAVLYEILAVWWENVNTGSHILDWKSPSINFLYRDQRNSISHDMNYKLSLTV